MFIMIRSLRDIRTSNKMTLEDVAHKLNTTKSTMSKIERGAQNLYIDQAILLADIYNVSLDELVGRKFNTKSIESEISKNFSIDDVRHKLSSYSTKDLYKLNGAIDSILDIRELDIGKNANYLNDNKPIKDNLN